MNVPKRLGWTVLMVPAALAAVLFLCGLAAFVALVASWRIAADLWRCP